MIEALAWPAAVVIIVIVVCRTLLELTNLSREKTMKAVLMSGLVFAFVLSAVGSGWSFEVEGVTGEVTLTEGPLTNGNAVKLKNKGGRNNEKEGSIIRSWGAAATNIRRAALERNPDRLIGAYTIGALTLSRVPGDIDAFLIAGEPAFTFLSLTQMGTGNEVPAAELESELGEAAGGSAAGQSAISQSGEGNRVSNLQQASGASNNAFLITQAGEGNIFGAAQTATVNYNSLEVSQSGSGNSGAISQTTSDYNSASIIQTGDSNLVQVTQLTGNGYNSIIVVQSGGRALIVTQTGSGNNLLIVNQ